MGAVRWRLSSGRWIEVHPAVYRLRSAPTTWITELLATLLWAGPMACASHRAAALLWKLDGVTHAPVEILAPTGGRCPGVIVHRLDPGDCPPTRVIDGIRVTAPDRTLLDLAGVAPVRVITLALDDALRRLLTSLEKLWAITREPGGQGRKGTERLRRLLEIRDPSWMVVESALETAFLHLMKRYHLPAATPQFEVRSRGRLIARLDFAYPHLKVGIETHGRRWHEQEDRWQRDIRRENALKRQGWTVLVYTWEDIRLDGARVAEEIRSVLASGSA